MKKGKYIDYNIILACMTGREEKKAYDKKLKSVSNDQKEINTLYAGHMFMNVKGNSIAFAITKVA